MSRFFAKRCCTNCGGDGHNYATCPAPKDHEGWRQRHADEDAVIAEIVKLLRAKVQRGRWPNVLMLAMASAQKADAIVLHRAERDKLEAALREIVH